MDDEHRVAINWRCLDAEREIQISARHRPHWEQEGALTFVTIRLADSMPKAVVLRWLREQEEWLQSQGVVLQAAIAKESLPDKMAINSPLRDLALAQAPRSIQRAFAKFRSQRWHENLDDCHGMCVLRQPQFAMIVAQSLLIFNEERYDVERFVIMPNHLHVLVQMRSGWELRKQCESWMRFTARQINHLNQTSGLFWSEPFDHVVRNEREFQYLQKYISDNPLKAGLGVGEYLLWIRDYGYL
jgi:putative transposase